MKSVRIDPQAIQRDVNLGKSTSARGINSFSKAMVSAQKDTVGDVTGVVGAFGNTVGQATYFGTGNSGAASVLSSAFSAMPEAYAAGSGGGGYGYYGGGGSVLGKTAGLDSSSYGGSAAAGGVTGDLSSSELMSAMNSNSMKLLMLQAQIQDHSQSTNMRSQIMSADHNAKRAIIEKLNGRAG